MREALRQGLISQDTIQNALTQAKGDIFIAACYLGCTASELDSYIRASEELQCFVGAIATVKLDPNYNRMADDQFGEQLDNLTRSYKIEALNIIHDMATMKFDSAAMAEVKLKAAIQLRGADVVAANTGGQLAVLNELNQLYQQNSPRIKSIRAEIEFQPPAING